MTRPPCAGQSALFDSVDPWDHQLAAELCATCPIIRECRLRLIEVKAAAHSGGQPEGTWAGQLLLDTRTRDEERSHLREGRAARLVFEETLYTDRDARQAHAAYTAGDRSQWARVGHKVYGRRAKRAQREAVAS